MSGLYDWVRNVSECSSFLENVTFNSTATVGIVPALKAWQAGVLVVVIGVLASVVAKLFNYLRLHIFKDRVGNQIFINMTCTGISFRGIRGIAVLFSFVSYISTRGCH